MTMRCRCACYSRVGGPRGLDPPYIRHQGGHEDNPMSPALDLTRRDLLQSALLAGGVLVSGSAAAEPPARGALPQAKPEDLHIDPRRLQVAYDLLEKWTTGPDAPVPGAAILVGRSGK